MGMLTTEYKRRVQELFREGPATRVMWDELSSAVLRAAQKDLSSVTEIETAIGMAKIRAADLAAQDAQDAAVRAARRLVLA
jgi:hypothetical protein